MTDETAAGGNETGAPFGARANGGASGAVEHHRGGASAGRVTESSRAGGGSGREDARGPGDPPVGDAPATGQEASDGIADRSAIAVDTTSPVPPYEQIRRQVAELIRHGVLREGDRLPPVRQLAGDLGLAVGTVARAYRELELGELVRSRRGAGTRVAARTPLTQAERDRSLADQADAFVIEARRVGVSAEEITAAVRSALERAP
jgi:DNA-binding transcriptional regulator YhcF (GntR family)